MEVPATEQTKIVSQFEVRPPIMLGDVLQQVENGASIHRLAATPEAGTLHFVFPDFDAARALFARISDHDLDINVSRMWKGQYSGNSLSSTIRTQSDYQ